MVSAMYALSGANACPCSLPQHTHPGDSLSHIYIDIMGPLPPSQGSSYLLTVMDRATRWPATIPLSGVTAEDCTCTFCLHWVADLPYSSILFLTAGANLFPACGHTLQNPSDPPYITPPATTRNSSCFHCSLKMALRACLTRSDWYGHLPWNCLHCAPQSIKPRLLHHRISIAPPPTASQNIDISYLFCPRTASLCSPPPPHGHHPRNL